MVVFLISTDSASTHCDRRRSRLVSKVVNEKLLPAFKALNTELSSECLFSPTRSYYHVQESHKSIEDASRWYCHFCGKAFYTEDFLDQHFNNRHADQLQEENALCLADVCEVFRCDVVGHDIVPDFWDFALCLEDDMKSLHHKCSLMVDSCIPSDLTENETRWLTNITTQELCSYLTCAKYWDIPFPSTDMSGTTGLYIVLTVMIILGLMVYYCLFFAYYYTDAFADAVVYDPAPRIKHEISPFQPDIRHRPRPVRVAPPP
ncbi:uncharacterized protein LOC143286024 [Babylonia areolata]|uniref:uncharacterized protein LOC143286024 n=1 Tax=Babylonia areolata TaxID=304850 RepID=UPI003FCEEAB5